MCVKNKRGVGVGVGVRLGAPFEGTALVTPFHGNVRKRAQIFVLRAMLPQWFGGLVPKRAMLPQWLGGLSFNKYIISFVVCCTSLDDPSKGNVRKTVQSVAPSLG